MIINQIKVVESMECGKQYSVQDVLKAVLGHVADVGTIEYSSIVARLTGLRKSGMVELSVKGNFVNSYYTRVK